jgi:hypothetical protein
MSQMGHFRQIDPLPTLSACPLRSDRVRTFAPQRIDAVAEWARGISLRASHRSGLDTLASSGSCHRTKTAAFH